MAKRILINNTANTSTNEITEALANEISIQGETVRGAILQRSSAVSRRDDKWGGRKFPFNIQIDFTGVDIEQLYSWAASTLVIQLQNQMRACNPEFIASLTANTIRRPAAEMGLAMNGNERAASNAKRAYAALTPVERRRMLIESMLEMGETVPKADLAWMEANKA